MHVEEAAAEELHLLALHRDRPRVLHRPLGDVDVVGAPAGDVAGAVVLDLEPADVLSGDIRVGLALLVHRTPVRAQLRIAHGVARRTEPEVEVEVLGVGRALEGRHLPLALRRVVDDAEVDARELAEAAVTHVLHALHEAGTATPVAALLRADVEHALHLPHGLHDRLALLHGKRHGLLHVDVLALVAGLHDHARVPVVLRADHHAVDAGVVQHLAVVHLELEVVHLALVAALGHGLHVREAHGVAVAHRGEHRKVLVGHEAANVHRCADAPAADQGDLEQVARS